MNHGFNRSGTQRCKCKNCEHTYTMHPKNRAYSEEIRQAAIKTYYSGVSGCGVGKIFGMSKANVYNWLKKENNKVWKNGKLGDTYELDELYWFIEKKARSETRENVYLMTMISRKPRQIVSFDVQMDRKSLRLQGVADNAPWAKNYCTDGNLTYLDVIFPGRHIRNVHDKRDTHNVESINADLRHYSQTP